MPAEDLRRPDIWPVDWLHWLAIPPVFAATVGARATIAGWWIWAAADLLLVCGLLLIERGPRPKGPRTAALARLVHGVAAVPVVFTQVGLLIYALRPVDHAPLLEHLDRLLCGGHNPLEALESIATPWLTEIMQWAYTAYLLLPIVTVIVLAGRASALGLSRALFVLLGVMYLSYLGYVLVPASGPNLHNTLGPLKPVGIPVQALYAFHDPLPGIWLAAPLRSWMFDVELTKKDCFPSGHVAVAIVCWWLVRRVDRRVSRWLLPVAIGVVTSTVYLRYHYVVDVVAGALLAWGGVALLSRLHDLLAARSGLAAGWAAGALGPAAPAQSGASKTR